VTGAADTLAALIAQARTMVCFTGAGISTESGIPDFRSPGTGLWTKMKPIPFDEFLASADVRQTSWQRRFESGPTIEDAAPNIGHEVIAGWVADGRCRAVITQNVDGLHQRAGVPDEQVIELHGNATFARCLSCQRRYELTDLEAQFRRAGRVADCDRCGGIIKSATISFGQPMPEDEMRRAHAATLDADLFLVAGSSLSVFPAASLPELAREHGAQLAIVNREPTHLDSLADCVVHGELGTTLSSVR
jgi:NAD-dependent deacetylase